MRNDILALAAVLLFSINSPGFGEPPDSPSLPEKPPASRVVLPEIDTVTDRPAALVLLLDTSASMRAKPDGSAASNWEETILWEVKKQLANLVTSVPPETDVFLYTFDNVLRPGPKVTVVDDTQRDLLREYFEELKAEGKKTHLWSSLDQVLTDAEEYAHKRPGARVRVLVYTDGEDNQENGPTASETLLEHSQLLTERGRVTYVTLGFTLQSDVRKTLTDHGVRVREAFNMSDIIPLSASFDFIPKKPQAGDRIQFIDFSSGLIREFEWSFARQATSRSRAPSWAPEKPGEYRVRLKIGDGRGDFDTVERVVRVFPCPPLNPSFRIEGQSLVSGHDVRFINDTSGPAVSFRWDFGNGRTSTDRNPTVRFDKAGKIVVKLTAVDAKGNTEATERRFDVASPQPPAFKVALSADRVEVGQAVRCIAHQLQNSDRVIWTTDDGQKKSGLDVEFQFDEAGDHVITGVASGDGGETTVRAKLSVVPLPVPQAEIVMAGPGQVVTGKEIRVLNATKFDRPFTSEWSVDGKTVRSPAAQLVLKPEKAGRLIVELTVTGPGGSTKDSVTITASAPRVPSPAISVATTKPTTFMPVSFVASADGLVTRYQWKVDGEVVEATAVTANGSGSLLTLVFEKPGTHRIEVTSVSPDGSATANVNIDVQAMPEPSPGFTIVGATESTDGSLTAVTGSSIRLVSTTTGRFDGLKWLHDGEPIGSDPEVVVDLTECRPHEFSLLALAKGSSPKTTSTVTVVPIAAPVLTVSAEDRQAVAGVPIVLTPTLTGQVDRVVWEIDGQACEVDCSESGDGSITHTFERPRDLTGISVHAVGPGGESEPVTFGIDVRPPLVAPTLKIKVSEKSRNAETVEFELESICQGTILRSEVDLGNGDVRTFDGPPDIVAHHFPVGDHNVIVRVFGPWETVATATKSVPVEEPPEWWEAHLPALIGIGSAVVLIGAWGARRGVQHMMRMRRRLIHGLFNFRPVKGGHEWQRVTADGESDKFEFELEPGLKATVQSVLDQTEGADDIRYQLTVTSARRRDALEHHEIVSGTELNAAGYRIQFISAQAT